MNKTPTSYIPDTNFFYFCQDGTIPKSIQRAFKKRVQKEGGQIYATVIPAEELLSHVNAKEQDDFPKYRQVLKAVKRVTTAWLPDPDTFLRQYFALDPRQAAILPDTWQEAIDRASRATTYLQLPEQGYAEDRVTRFRKTHEMKFVNQVEAMARMCIRNFDAKRAKGKIARITDAGLLKEVEGFLGSGDFNMALAEALIERSGSTLTDFTIAKKQDVVDDFRALRDAYSSFLRDIFRNGYSIRKHKNDCNDLHQLLYLAEGNHKIITGDDKLVSRLKYSSEKDKVITPQTLGLAT